MVVQKGQQMAENLVVDLAGTTDLTKVVQMVES
jgi:hypothetical protein